MEIGSLPIESFGASGILCLVVLLILRGFLIPRRTHMDRMADKDAQIEYYRLAVEREQDRNEVLSAQVGTLLEVARTADHVLSSLPVAINGGDGSESGRATQEA